MARIQKSLSYVLGDSDSKKNHILAVNSLQYSNSLHTLFTAGRDGVVKSWIPKQSNVERNHNGNGVDTHTFQDKTGEVKDSDGDGDNKNEEGEEEDELQKLEEKIQSSSITYRIPTNSNYQIFNSFQLHSDWINDLKLINNDTHFATCSSDLSIKITNITTSETSIFKTSQESHTDYIKKITHSPKSHPHRLITGALDKKIIVWDINTLKPISSYNTPSSIYSLSTTSNIISASGPNNKISLFDSRMIESSAMIAQLTGHQDTVRALLSSGDYVLSGSSDSTIKLWDLRKFKCLRTFDMHDESVWCLHSSDINETSTEGFSENENFAKFYSGDRSGQLVYTDQRMYLRSLANCPNSYNQISSSVNGTSDENASFIHYSSTNENLGVSILLAHEPSGILSICSGDNSIWSSNLTSFNRIHDIDIEDLAIYQYRRIAEKGDWLIHNQSQVDEVFDIVSMFSGDTSINNYNNGVIGSNGDENNEWDNLNNFLGVDGENMKEDQIFDSMFLSINGGPSLEYMNGEKLDGVASDDFLDNSVVEILYENIPTELISIKPFNLKPFESFKIEPSVVEKKLLNNKRHVLTMNNVGDIKLWDLLSCKALKDIPRKSTTPSTSTPEKSDEITVSQSAKKLNEDDLNFEKTVELFQSEEVLSNWCNVEIKTGKLLITITPNNYLNCEVYLDKLLESYPEVESQIPHKINKFNNDSRFYTGAILINSIFKDYIDKEYQSDSDLRNKLKESTYKKSSSSKKNLHKMLDLSTSSTTNITKTSSNDTLDKESKLNLKTRFFNRKSSSKIMTSTLTKTSTATSTPESETNSTVSTNSDSDLQINSNTDILDQTTAAFIVAEIRQKYVNESDVQETLLKSSLPENFVPKLDLPPDLQVIISERSPSLGNSRDVLAFTIKDVSDIMSKYESKGSADKFFRILRNVIPKWIGDLILSYDFAMKESPKIGFSLEPVNSDSLPKTDFSVTRLNSHGMLRVKKILGYLPARFEEPTKEMKNGVPPEQWLELLCNGEVMDINCTLSTIRTRKWKSGGDIVFHYRRKMDRLS